MSHSSKSTASLCLFLLLAQYIWADSLRCENKVITLGETKADVLATCGDPQLIDSYCRPLVSAFQVQQQGSQDTSTTTTLTNTNCENVDIWTYNRGQGHFAAHLYFAQGQLQEIKRGERRQ